MLVKHVPHGPLARHVHSMWYRPSVGVDETAMLLLPSGRSELVISLDLSPQRSWQSTTGTHPGRRMQGPAMLQLLRAGPFATASSGRAAAIGVSFKPCGLRAFTPVALSDHDDKHVSLADLWGAGVQSWVERMALAPTPADKFRLLEGLLWQQLRPALPQMDRIEQAVDWLSDPFTARSVASVAEGVGMSERMLVQSFRENIGLTPKVFARVMRFRAAAHGVRQRGQSRWTDVAALCNYFDQAHLVREFHALAGMSPSAYLQLRGGHATCLPLAPAASNATLFAGPRLPWLTGLAAAA